MCAVVIDIEHGDLSLWVLDPAVTSLVPVIDTCDHILVSIIALTRMTERFTEVSVKWELGYSTRQL
jgi:hypothetical protein